jgi:hypothetical protein
VDIKIKDTTDSKNKEFKDEYIIIAIDSTSIKVTNRDQGMKDKWHVKNKSKKYLKIHIVAVNVKTKENTFHEGHRRAHSWQQSGTRIGWKYFKIRW